MLRTNPKMTHIPTWPSGEVWETACLSCPWWMTFQRDWGNPHERPALCYFRLLGFSHLAALDRWLWDGSGCAYPGLPGCCPLWSRLGQLQCATDSYLWWGMGTWGSGQHNPLSEVRQNALGSVCKVIQSWVSKTISSDTPSKIFIEF